MVYTKARLEHALKVLRQPASHRKRRGLSDTHLSQYMIRRPRDTTKSRRHRNSQNWYFPVVENDTEEDEYDPAEDRKKQIAARKKRKEANLKRKAGNENEEQKSSKRRRKGEELLHRGDKSGFSTLILTTQKGKAKLQELSQGLRTSRGYSGQQSPGNTREYDERKEHKGVPRDGVQSGPDDLRLGDMLMDIDDVTDMDVNLSKAGGLAEWLSRTSLRSGRVLKKPVQNTFNDNNNNHSSGLPSIEEADNEQVETKQQDPPHPGISSIGRPTTPIDGSIGDSIGKSFDRPIDIDTSDNERFESPKQAGKIWDKIVPIGSRIKQPIRATSRFNRSLTPRHGRPSRFRHEPEIGELSTPYVHPINFLSMPRRPNESYCDFCTDWTMGIVGHKKRTAIAIPDPRSPTGFIIRDKHQGDPRPPTKMCVKCSLDRHFIMTCHRPRHQRARVSPLDEARTTFMRINNGLFTREQTVSYLDYLFPEDRKTPWLRGEKQGPIPSCSLCPQPASWRCCKWQKLDQARRPCRIPESPSEARAAASAVVSLSSSRPTLSPALGRSSSIADRTSNIASTSRSQHRKLEVISLLDSSDEEDESTSSPTTSSKATTASSSTPTHPSPAPARTTTQSSIPLRPPIQGCGLHLCEPCHRFLNVTSDCNGLLYQEKVMKYLEGRKIGGRADLEWLFEGSLLQRALDRSGRKSGGRG